jgi:hypothetical protein
VRLRVRFCHEREAGQVQREEEIRVEVIEVLAWRRTLGLRFRRREHGLDGRSGFQRRLVVI